VIISIIWCLLAIAAATPYCAYGYQYGLVGEFFSGLFASGTYLTAAIAWGRWRAEHWRPISSVAALLIAALGARTHFSGVLDAFDGFVENPYELFATLPSFALGLILGAVATLLGVVTLLLWRPDPLD
jgi:hypothetical protein